MSPELKSILDERADTTVWFNANITKSSEEIIYRFAKYYDIGDLGLALDMILQMPHNSEEWEKIGSTI